MRANVDDLFKLGDRRGRRRRHEGLRRHRGPDVDAQPDDGARRHHRHEQAESDRAGRRLRHELRDRNVRHSRHQRPDPRQSGMPSFDDRAAARSATTTRWTPLERHETSYTVTTNLTKLMGAHEIRTGFDFIRYQLNHWQPELGAGPRGDFNFSGNITGQPGYTVEPVEPVRRVPSRPGQRLRQERPVRRDDRPRKPVRHCSSATAGSVSRR